MSKVMVDEHFMRDEAPLTGALETLLKARVVEFTASGTTGDMRQQGVVGQSLGTCPAAEEDGLGYHYVDHEKLVPLLVAALQELNAKVEAKRTRKKPSEE